MNKQEIKEKINSEEYEFLRANEHLGNNIILLTIGGSHAYGTSIETSDLDIRGIAIERPQEIIGLSSFERFEDKDTDTVIYGLKKIFNLLLKANPNILEIFLSNEDQILFMNDYGRVIKNNINIFLSKQIINSFGGFARSEFNKYKKKLKVNPEYTDYKNMMCTIRVLQIGTELLEGKEVKLYRDNNEFLLKIRKGEISQEELLTIMDEEEAKFKYAAENTSLPDKPDFERAEDLLMAIYKKEILSKKYY